MKTSSLSAQLNGSNIHFLENLSLHHSISQPLTSLNRKKRTISRIRANKDLKTASDHVYQENILRLLDALNSPILMLPRVEQDRVVQSIGFFTDLRFTGHSTLSLVARMARSYHAAIVIFNVSESHLPPMDPGYAESLFKRQGLETIDGVPARLVNLTLGTASEMEKVFAEHQIGMLTALQERKNLLYSLIA